MLSDIFPTGFHGAVSAGVTVGTTVYVAGAGPVGLACAAGCRLLGAAVVIVGDSNKERLAQAKKMGCETVDISDGASVPEQLEKLLGEPFVDAAVDCVGYEAHACSHHHHKHEDAPAAALNAALRVVKSAGSVGVPGLYVTHDPGAADEKAKHGALSIEFGVGWAKAATIVGTGQCPVMRYHRRLLNAILYERVHIADAVNASVISLDQAPQGYRDFDKGAARKFVIDPHGCMRK
eukprot:TRINITY_DN152_c0_g1_i3.p1 TRINITY_DN152_c0_g1~~TRINITY_DN152_c0_g1_i3.p1  ORF type:complete len:235 (+),score=55.18 TRINITY_DN152_c0_g1_i3:271-975(+)